MRSVVAYNYYYHNYRWNNNRLTSIATAHFHDFNSNSIVAIICTYMPSKMCYLKILWQITYTVIITYGHNQITLPLLISQPASIIVNTYVRKYLYGVLICMQLTSSIILCKCTLCVVCVYFQQSSNSSLV